MIPNKTFELICHLIVELEDSIANEPYPEFRREEKRQLRRLYKDLKEFWPIVRGKGTRKEK